MDKYVTRLFPICEASGSNVYEVVRDIQMTAYRMNGNNIYGSYEYYEERLIHTVLTMLHRHYHMNGKYRTYEELVSKMMNYCKNSSDLNYLEVKFGKRNLQYGVKLIEYNLEKE